MNQFKSFRIFSDGQKVSSRLVDLTTEDLTEGDVVVKVCYSSINYKDALAATGKGKILRKFPLNGGIDLSGIVHESAVEEYKPGDKVLVNGCGLSEEYDGGYSEFSRVKSESIVKLPNGLSLREAMVLGTAGFTASLCMHKLYQNNQKPEQGPILVTGSTGGVGSISIQILSQNGFEVWALTSKKHKMDYLKRIGASKVVSLDELKLGDRPLEKACFGGAIDNLGGSTLSKIIRHVGLWGNVCSVGLVRDHKFEASVMPHILRGVSLLGISSNNCPQDLRKKLWNKLAQDWKPLDLKMIEAAEVDFQDLAKYFDEYLNNNISGRIVVKVSSEDL